MKAGTIRYRGHDITGKAAFELVRLGLAMVPEGRGVFGALTIEENLAMGAYTRSDKAGIRSDIDRVYTLFRGSRNAAGKRRERCRAASSRCSRWLAR